MKARFPPIDIKFTDRIAYYNAFDEYYVKHNLAPMENLLAGYLNARLDFYLREPRKTSVIRHEMVLQYNHKDYSLLSQV